MFHLSIMLQRYPDLVQDLIVVAANSFYTTAINAYWCCYGTTKGFNTAETKLPWTN